ncbi:hypothetical protein ACFVJM_33835 [Streptomyces virginiae]|uniref:hypothetical protein n=1 Tax=Streptomyces virginiae TaxID=1961 RepID=UPI003627B3B4
MALGAAWRAGAYAWTPQRRLEYANDLDVLLAVDKRTNARRCTGVKAKYGLSVTAPEKRALQDMLAACPQ